jgi:beta-glucosidase
LELDYSEGNYIDYKYFDKYNITPRFQFGHGLSYTTFNYSSSITIKPNTTTLASAYKNGALAVGGRKDLWDVVATVTSSISNTGSTAGAEVAQLYVTFPDAADEPVRQLRGFKKVTIQAEESVDVAFTLRKRDLSI